MDGQEEKKLIAKAKKGDTDSFEKLIEGCKLKAYNLCFHYMKHEEDAKDALQESFIKIFRYLKEFKGESSFDTWVYRIVANTCNDLLKKGRRHLNNEPLVRTIDGQEVMIEISDEKSAPEVVLDRKEKIRAILLAMDTLPAIYREVVILRDIQGFTYEQISKVLNCSEGAVKSRISRARIQLRENLKQNKKNCV